MAPSALSFAICGKGAVTCVFWTPLYQILEIQAYIMLPLLPVQWQHLLCLYFFYCLPLINFSEAPVPAFWFAESSKFFCILSETLFSFAVFIRRALYMATFRTAAYWFPKYEHVDTIAAVVSPRGFFFIRTFSSTVRRCVRSLGTAQNISWNGNFNTFQGFFPPKGTFFLYLLFYLRPSILEKHTVLEIVWPPLYLVFEVEKVANFLRGYLSKRNIVCFYHFLPLRQTAGRNTLFCKISTLLGQVF